VALDVRGGSAKPGPPRLFAPRRGAFASLGGAVEIRHRFPLVQPHDPQHVGPARVVSLVGDKRPALRARAQPLDDQANLLQAEGRESSRNRVGRVKEEFTRLHVDNAPGE